MKQTAEDNKEIDMSSKPLGYYKRLASKAIKDSARRPNLNRGKVLMAKRTW